MPKTSTKKIFFIIVAVFIISIVAWCILFLVIKKNVMSSNELKAQVASNETVEQQNHTLKAFFNDNEDSITSIEKRIISKDGTADFIDSIETLAKKDNVSIQTKSVGLEDATEGKEYEYLKLGVDIQGTWTNVYKFIALLQQLPYKMKINTISLNQSTFVSTHTLGSSTVSTTDSFWTSTINFETLKNK